MAAANIVNNTPFSVTDRAPQKTVTNDIAANAEVQALIDSCNTNALFIKKLLPLALIVGEIDFNTASYNLEGRMRMVAGLKSALVLGMTYIVRSLIFVLGMFRSGANVGFVTISRQDYDAKMTDAAFSVSAYACRGCVVAALERSNWIALFLAGATMRTLNYLKTNHCSCGEVLSTPQMQAFAAIMGMIQRPANINAQNYAAMVTYVFYHAYHALDYQRVSIGQLFFSAWLCDIVTSSIRYI